MNLQLLAPQPLQSIHELSEFDCGEPELNTWLKQRGFSNHQSGASRTFVVTDPDQRVYGYYALAAGAVAHPVATGAVRRSMPDPIPVVVLARLAVDREATGIKLGAALLKDAVKRAAAISEQLGVCALLAHALHERAREFYEHFGFQPSPLHPLTVMLRL